MAASVEHLLSVSLCENALRKHVEDLSSLAMRFISVVYLVALLVAANTKRIIEHKEDEQEHHFYSY